METQLRTRLLNAAPVAAIVGNRISWGVRPQGEAYPSIVLTIVSDPRPQDYKGNIAHRSTRVQADCYGTTRAQVVALREAVIAAIVPTATVGGVTFRRAFIENVVNRDAHTDTGLVFRDMVDFNIWHG